MGILAYYHTKIIWPTCMQQISGNSHANFLLDAIFLFYDNKRANKPSNMQWFDMKQENRFILKRVLSFVWYNCNINEKLLCNKSFTFQAMRIIQNIQYFSYFCLTYFNFCVVLNIESTLNRGRWFVLIYLDVMWACPN